MIELKIYNDAKEKHQSFEAWIDGIDCEVGYGYNEDEAMKEYQSNLEKLQLRLTIALQDLKLGNFDKIDVNYSGIERS